MEEEKSEARDEEAAPDNNVKNAETIVDENHRRPYTGCRRLGQLGKEF